MRGSKPPIRLLLPSQEEYRLMARSHCTEPGTGHGQGINGFQ